MYTKLLFALLALLITPKAPKLELKLPLPEVMYTKQHYTPYVRVLGTIPDVPMCIYVTTDITEQGPSCGDHLFASGREYKISLYWPVEWWLFKKGWSRQLPGAHDNTILDSTPLHEMDVEEDYAAVKVTVSVELYEVEQRTDTLEWKRVKKLASVAKTVRVECTNDTNCRPPIGVR